MELSAHEKDHLRALVLSQDVDGVTEFMAAKVDGVTLPGVGTDTPPNEVVVSNPEVVPAKSSKDTAKGKSDASGQ